MCLNIGTPNNQHFPFGTNEKVVVLSVPILKHFRVNCLYIFMKKMSTKSSLNFFFGKNGSVLQTVNSSASIQQFASGRCLLNIGQFILKVPLWNIRFLLLKTAFCSVKVSIIKI